MKLAKPFLVQPGEKARLHKRDAADTLGISKADANTEPHIEELRELQDVLYADKRYALLVVLQGLDAGGKDGTIRHIFSGVNPQGCQVTAFKEPTPEELDHDFLWRVHRVVPGRGFIGIFNRSHYEDVLVGRVHRLVPKTVWSARYDQINDFEKTLDENKVRILKFYLHISKDEQLRRLQDRLTDPKKNWKLSLLDFREREHWDEYMAAYEDALTKCSTNHAPWYVIPSDHKWFRNYAIGAIVNDTLKHMKLRYPAAKIDLSQIHLS
ncbi:MAG TPA: polyphosphate kinase 2 family protein [Bryobacteraceae bacterium]|nr:polyphosphate kinase 2 family protein [Bryobacteraceae bacterium]